MNATRIKKGKIQVVDVTYKPNGTSIVTPVSEWLPIIPANITTKYPTSKELLKGTKYEALFL